ncbi:cytochrome c oxidase assembly protein [Acidiphilium sp. PA]|uniref:cytochrome c oxidase assembly protein n=1 Tax=Acidiphilium sp. PA TaxID=2871705 RepID=UPI0022446D91|nr:cytochrome c oxidase assembly protein [Acidiphilium sp. PA]MCW8308034.1 cytochrome c oxidase assembly protein [Acidiphilium sp. PA]
MNSPGRRGRQAAWTRDAFFTAAILLLFLVLQSPIEGFSDQFLTIHQVEHMTLDMIAPLLLMLAAPQAPLLRGMPAWLRHKLVPGIVGNGALHRSFAVVSQPIPASFLFIGTSDFWMIPRVHDASLRIPLIHDVWHVTLFASGLIFFFRLLDPRPAPLGAPLLARILMCFSAEMNFILFGFYLSAKSIVLYNAYGRMAPFWHISALSDERFGGLTMWIDGSTMITLGALIALHRLASHEERIANRRIALASAPPLRDSQYSFGKRRENRNLAFGLIGFVGFMLIGTVIAAVVYDHMTNPQVDTAAFIQVRARTPNGPSAPTVSLASKLPPSDKP